MADNLFIGKWQLDPTKSDYEHGFPPQSGTYIITSEGNGLKFAMAWTGVDGKSFEMAYHAIPDGVDYPYENPQVADTLSLTLVDDHTLDSDSKKGGKVSTHGRRSLSPDGQTMTIVQSGTTAEGQPYRNLSVYERQP